MHDEFFLYLKENITIKLSFTRSWMELEDFLGFSEQNWDAALTTHGWRSLKIVPGLNLLIEDLSILKLVRKVRYATVAKVESDD